MKITIPCADCKTLIERSLVGPRIKICSACKKSRKRVRYHMAAEYRRALQSKYYRENREIIKERRRNAYAENKNGYRDKILAAARENIEMRKEKLKERSKQDPKWRLSRNMRTAVWRALGNGKFKTDRTFNTLGYSVDELRDHLESKFQEGMTWDNYGQWHVDHKIPLSVFNYETSECLDFKKAWSLSNLQPLWALDNYRKTDRLNEPFQPSLF
jgi:hypothetical protein